MISQAAITAWRKTAPWMGSDQVEHDLVLSRAICELYQDPLICEQLVFRGGTALHKLFFSLAGRFSEDLDFVQRDAGPIGELVDNIRDCLDPWLGTPSYKRNHGRFTLYYKFETELKPIVARKVKIEINTREHFSVQPYAIETYSVSNKWFSGEANVLTYSLEELLATKLRALYQRKKGRDLYDFWYVVKQNLNLNVEEIIKVFRRYMEAGGKSVSRAEFERNIHYKQNDKVFNGDIQQLLSVDQFQLYNIDEAYIIVLEQFIPRLPGEPWKVTAGALVE